MKTLRQYLAERGMTQVQFADAVGIRQSHVSKLCGDNPPISADLAARIARHTQEQVPVSVWPQFEALRPWLRAKDVRTPDPNAKPADGEVG